MEVGVFRDVDTSIFGSSSDLKDHWTVLSENNNTIAALSLVEALFVTHHRGI